MPNKHGNQVMWVILFFAAAIALAMTIASC